MTEYKILITGTMGAGKTTAIGAISEIPPIITDVRNSDESSPKAQTTVGLDYGEVTLDQGDKLRLYGTPGQARFAFLWKILAQGALGLIVLVDHSRPDPQADLLIYLENFRDLIKRTACVVGVGRTVSDSSNPLDAYSVTLAKYGVICPVLAVDVRAKGDVMLMIDLMLTQLEARE